MKRRLPFMIAVLIFALGLISCSSQENITDDSYVISDEPLHEPNATAQPGTENDIVPEADPLGEAIKAAIVEQNKGNYLPGEYYGVGYKIIETFEEDSVLSVYALTEYVEYRFQDNVFVNISGTNPKVLMRFQETEDKKYDLIFYTRLDILSDLPEEKIEELLQPLAETGKSYVYTNEDLEEVRAQADEDAIAYLESINRVADVGVRENHKGNLLTDLVSDTDFVLELLKDYSHYPEWTGTQEWIENNIRYIYQTEYDEALQQIIFSKILFDTNEIVERQVIDIQDYV